MSDFVNLAVEDPKLRADEMLLAKNVAETLHATYPGHLWAVSVESSFIIVRDLSLTGNYGFRIDIPAIYSASDLRRTVIRAGGEILERFGASRSERNIDRGDNGKDFAGRFIQDTSGIAVPISPSAAIEKKELH